MKIKKLIGYILIGLLILRVIGLIYMSNSNPESFAKNSVLLIKNLLLSIAIFGSLGVYLIFSSSKNSK